MSAVSRLDWPLEDAVLLRCEELHARHEGADRDALRGAWFEVRRGQLVALVGPNGSGKSTLLSTLGREIEARCGEIRLAADERPSRSRRAWARRVARLPQEPLAPPGLTVEQLVERGRHPHRALWSPPSRTDREAVARALRRLDLQDLRTRPIEQLSGGERRRAWLALVLAQEADVLLLDEPMSGLDLAHRLEVGRLLRELARQEGKAIVVVMHDLEEALGIVDRVGVMHRGRLYAFGRPEDALDATALRDVFGLDARLVADSSAAPPAHPGALGVPVWRLLIDGPATGRRFL